MGTAGNDTLRGTPGNDVMFGGGGRDNIFGGRGDDLICGGPWGAFTGDFLQVLDGGPGRDTLVGGPHDDELVGGTGADVLLGNSGFDLVLGGGGRDDLHGGRAQDLMDGGELGDRIFGDGGADAVFDSDGANPISGGKGPDHIASGPGNDTIDGGSGRDIADYMEISDGTGSGGHCNDITVDLSQGIASGAGFGVDGLDSIETVATAGGNDVLIGDDGPNGFFAGFPCFNKQSPTDSLDGVGGVDRVFFADPALGESASGRVRVDLRNHTAQLGSLGGSPVVFTLESIENVTGTDFRDVILGDGGPNVLDAGGSSAGDVIAGRGGDDEVTGRIGGDDLRGGAGDDVLRGGGGADHLDGGPGRNRNDGGAGLDTCLRPSRGSLAISCER